MSDENDFVDGGEFVVTGPVWFLAPEDFGGRAERIYTAAARLRGQEGGVVLAFTDLDLAERHIAQTRGNPLGLKPVTNPTPQEFGLALAALALLGETHVAFDVVPGRNRGRLFLISKVLDAIPRSRR